RGVKGGPGGSRPSLFNDAEETQFTHGPPADHFLVPSVAVAEADEVDDSRDADCSRICLVTTGPLSAAERSEGQPKFLLSPRRANSSTREMQPPRRGTPSPKDRPRHRGVREDRNAPPNAGRARASPVCPYSAGVSDRTWSHRREDLRF